MGIAISRDGGLLKRLRGTPLPPAALIAGYVIHSVFVAMILVAVVLIAGVLAFGVDAPTTRFPAFLLTLAVGAATFCALGVAVAMLIPTQMRRPPSSTHQFCRCCSYPTYSSPWTTPRVAHHIRGHLSSAPFRNGHARVLRSVWRGIRLRSCQPAGYGGVDGWRRAGGRSILQVGASSLSRSAQGILPG